MTNETENKILLSQLEKIFKNWTLTHQAKAFLCYMLVGRHCTESDMHLMFGYQFHNISVFEIFQELGNAGMVKNTGTKGKIASISEREGWCSVLNPDWEDRLVDSTQDKSPAQRDMPPGTRCK